MSLGLPLNASLISGPCYRNLQDVHAKKQMILHPLSPKSKQDAHLFSCENSKKIEKVIGKYKLGNRKEIGNELGNRKFIGKTRFACFPMNFLFF